MKPSKFFYKMVGYNIIYAVSFGILLGGLWMFTNTILDSSTSRGDNLRIFSNVQVISILVDSAVIFTAVYVSTIMGLCAQSLAVTTSTIRDAMGRYFRSMMSTMIINIIVNGALNFAAMAMNSGIHQIYLLVFNIITATVIGYYHAYRSYCIYAVYTPSSYRQYHRQLAALHGNRSYKTLRMLQMMLPAYQFDATRPGFFMFPLPMIALLSFLLSYGGLSMLDNGFTMFPWLFIPTLCLFVCLWSAGVRHRDITTSPEPGLARLKPHFISDYNSF